MADIPTNSNKGSLVGRITPRQTDTGGAVTTVVSRITSYAPGAVEALRILKKKEKPGQLRKRATFMFCLFLRGVAGLADIIQIILDGFAVGLVANRIIDLVIGILLAIIMLVKGLSPLTHFKLYASVVGALIVEEIPVVDIAPAWSIDAHYIIRTIQAEDAAHNAEIERHLAEEHANRLREARLRQAQQQEQQQQEAQAEEDAAEQQEMNEQA